MSAVPRRDIIVIGASTGGVEALTALVGMLPADLPASVLVVRHASEHSPRVLGEILIWAGPFGTRTARSGSGSARQAT